MFRQEITINIHRLLLNINDLNKYLYEIEFRLVTFRFLFIRSNATLLILYVAVAIVVIVAAHTSRTDSAVSAC